MARGSLMRRAFPYFLIAFAGFTLAFAVAYFFILPEAPPEDFASSDSTRVSSPKNNDAPSAEDIMPDVQEPALPLDELPPVQTATPIIMPELVSKDIWEGQQMLDRLGLTVVIRRDTSSFELPNTIVRQTPLAGQRLLFGDTVYMTVSQFPPPR